MKLGYPLLAALAVVSVAVWAQDAPAADPPADAAPPDAAQPADAAETPPPPPLAPLPEPEPPAPKGDKLILKSGQVIEGLQIKRESAAEYVLEVTETVTMRIPRRQVVSIERDDYEPGHARPKPEPTLVPGQRLSNDLQAHLGTDISNPPIESSGRDFIEVVQDVNARVGGVVVVDPSVSALPAPERAWTVTIPAGTTLSQFLQDHLMQKFPDLVTLFENDKIRISTKDAVAAPEDTEAADSPVTPGAPPPAPTADAEPPTIEPPAAP